MENEWSPHSNGRMFWSRIQCLEQCWWSDFESPKKEWCRNVCGVIKEEVEHVPVEREFDANETAYSLVLHVVNEQQNNKNIQCSLKKGWEYEKKCSIFIRKRDDQMYCIDKCNCKKWKG